MHRQNPEAIRLPVQQAAPGELFAQAAGEAEGRADDETLGEEAGERGHAESADLAAEAGGVGGREAQSLVQAAHGRVV